MNRLTLLALGPLVVSLMTLALVIGLSQRPGVEYVSDVSGPVSDLGDAVDDLSRKVDALDNKIDSLSSTVDAVQETVNGIGPTDLSDVTDEIGTLAAQIEDLRTAFCDRFEAC